VRSASESRRRLQRSIARTRAFLECRRATGNLRLAEGGASFVGASPERLLRRDGDEVRADALAGSAARGRNPEEDACRRRALFETIPA
jgi:isochorismate synthase EntC